MMPPLSDISHPSTESIGLFVLILVYLSRWFFDYSRNRREEAAQLEPKANPPLHQTFATKEAHAELKREIDKLDNERRVSVAKLHDKQEAMGTRLARVEEKCDGQTRQLHQLQNSVENLPDRIRAAMKS